MEFKMDEASIDGALKTIKENKEVQPFDLLTELEKQMREFDNNVILFERAKERERVIRLPNVVPTEISVGQSPSSEERKEFERWMANIGGGGSVNDKLKIISHYFENPGEQIQGSSIPEVLSYLMFLNYFTWMLKEFNAAVAGFLWEPFLASLFGGKSRQVPTSEHDIADIRIDTPMGKNEPISLKILNKDGDVKGSFTDLVNHFAKGGENMRYVIVVKEQSGKRKDVSAVTFYEFDINNDTFFDWIGYLEHTQTVIPIDIKFKLDKDKMNKKKQAYFRRGPDSGVDNPASKQLNIRHAYVTKNGRVNPKWLRIVDIGAKKAGSLWIAGDGAEEVKLRTAAGPVSPGDVLDPNGVYEATVARYEAGGQVKKSQTPGARAKKGYEEVPGVGGKSTDKIWGSPEARGQWLERAKELPRNEFWAKVAAEAPGYQKNAQFYITPAHYKGKGEKIGHLRITDQKVKEVFKLGAEQIGPQLTSMFNAMADLTDNIGRFFLTDCGGAKCGKNDMKNQDAAGQAAIQNSQTLKVTVEESVKGMRETGTAAAAAGVLGRGKDTPKYSGLGGQRE